MSRRALAREGRSLARHVCIKVVAHMHCGAELRDVEEVIDDAAVIWADATGLAGPEGGVWS